MNREDIIRMARESRMFRILDEHASEYGNGTFENTLCPELERFAALVAAHTLSNIDPSKFMSYREGFEVGTAAEREACAKACDEVGNQDSGNHAWDAAAAIRARSNQ